MEQAAKGSLDVTNAEETKRALRDASTACRGQANFVVGMQHCPMGQDRSAAGEGASIVSAKAASSAVPASRLAAEPAERARTQSRLKNTTTTNAGGQNRDCSLPRGRLTFGGADQSTDAAYSQPLKREGSFGETLADLFSFGELGARASASTSTAPLTGAGMVSGTLKSDKPSHIMAEYLAWAAEKGRSSVQLYGSAGQRSRKSVTSSPSVPTIRVLPAPEHVAALAAAAAAQPAATAVAAQSTAAAPATTAAVAAQPAAAALATVAQPAATAEVGVQTKGAASVRAGPAKRTGGRQRKHFREQRWKLNGYFPCNDAISIECWNEHGNLVECGRTEYLHSPYCRHLRSTTDGLPHAGAVDGGLSRLDCSRWERSTAAAHGLTASGGGGRLCV